MQNNQDEKEDEIFSSASNVAGGSNDKRGLGLLLALIVLVVGAAVLNGLGITGILMLIIPGIVAFIVYIGITSR